MNQSDIQLREVQLTSLLPSGTNPRQHFDEAELQELIASVKLHGILQPILVRPLDVTQDQDGIGQLEIVAGERRYRAALAAGLETVPAQIRHLTDVQVIEMQIIENLQRSNIRPLEEAAAYRRLMDLTDTTAEQIAEKVGKSRTYVYDTLHLLELKPPAQDALNAGLINRSIAGLISRISSTDNQLSAVKQITEGTTFRPGAMSTREAKELLRRGFSRHLNQAIFEQNQNSGGLVSCKQCPRRSGNDMLLLGEYENDTDICTDISCFEAKTTRHIDAIAKEQKEEGFEVSRGPLKKGMIDGDSTYLISIGVYENYHDLVPQKKRIATNLRHVTEQGHVLVVYRLADVKEHLIKLGKIKVDEVKAGATRKESEAARAEPWETEGQYKFQMRMRIHDEIICKLPQVLAGGGEGLLPLLMRLIVQQSIHGWVGCQSWFATRWEHEGEPIETLQSEHVAAACLLQYTFAQDDSNVYVISDWNDEFPVLNAIGDFMDISFEVNEADRIAAAKAAIPASEAA
jgi:ParB/RepB/Spo0J family partition protein